MAGKLKLTHFDMAEVLDCPEAIAEYLNQVVEGGDLAELSRALGHVAKAMGVAQIAERSGLGRESLYKVFQAGAQPRYETIDRITKAMGVELRFVPAR